MITDEDLQKHKIQWAENQGTLQKISGQRAQFAAMAMQGMLASDPNQSLTVETVAKWSVQCADALIEELKK